MLTGKTILLGVTGGIAAYKIPNLASALVKLHADVRVVMTKNACNFITPTTFETLTGHKCLVDTFDRDFEFNVNHVALAKAADVILIAPATANVIAKLANGIADDMLTTTVLASTAPLLIAPAMNTQMLHAQVTQDNIEKLRGYGARIIPSGSGYLACGDAGDGRMPEPEILKEYILQAVLREKDMIGKKVLVTAGPTQEAIDPVRCITNHSTGKMGIAVAREAACRGADVTLVCGPISDTAVIPPGVECVNVISAAEMYEAVVSRFPETDAVVKAAAVADYRPKHVSDQKVKKHDDEMTIELERTQDILGTLGAMKRPGQVLCGFAMETQDLIANARAKLEKKNLDMIVANNLKVAGAGFGTDTNVVTIITKEEEEVQLPLVSKADVAHEIMNRIAALCRETES